MVKKRISFKGRGIPLCKIKKKRKYSKVDVKLRGIKHDNTHADKLKLFLARQKKVINKYDQELEYFWARINTCNRMRLLKELAEVKIHNKKSYKQRLEDFKKITCQRSKKCFIVKCNNKTNARHHIILLKHGGKNTARNLLTLCDKHHEQVHPWLNDNYVESSKHSTVELPSSDLVGRSHISGPVCESIASSDISLQVAAHQLCQA